MELSSIKAILVFSWVLLVYVAGIATGVNTASGWIALSILALGPAVVVLVRWNHPTQTMSESIDEARR